jgi:redox-sensitive bicupin YhaK (pirin superfamily)
MLDIIKADRRHFSDMGWLKTYWLFSFSDYYDPRNLRFGALRVFNDDVVEPGTGFPTHPHDEMEIVTIVLSGEMTHADSMGNKAVIRPGDVQRMSAGTGLTHSEFNLAAGPVHFYQIWIYPDQAGLTPSYDQKTHRPADWQNRLLPVASGQQSPTDVVTLHTDATIYRCALDAGKQVVFRNTAGRGTFLYLADGSVTVHGQTLRKEDQARIATDEPLVIAAGQAAELILIDVPVRAGRKK